VGLHRRLPLKIPLGAAGLAVVLFLTRSLWLPGLGWALVNDQGPAKADIAVVLAGDYWGNRIVRGAELVRQGYVPAVLVSGPPGFYTFRESDLAIQFAVRQGYPEAWFIPLPNDALSTRDEGPKILLELQRRGVHRFLLVTSSYHTARAARIYRALERGMPGAPSFRMVAARDQFFRPDSWWRSREGQKIVFMEWCKTVANFLGL